MFRFASRQRDSRWQVIPRRDCVANEGRSSATFPLDRGVHSGVVGALLFSIIRYRKNSDRYRQEPPSRSYECVPKRQLGRFARPNYGLNFRLAPVAFVTDGRQWGNSICTGNVSNWPAVFLAYRDHPRRPGGRWAVPLVEDPFEIQARRGSREFCGNVRLKF